MSKPVFVVVVVFVVFCSVESMKVLCGLSKAGTQA